jgi:hypothetical protein
MMLVPWSEDCLAVVRPKVRSRIKGRIDLGWRWLRLQGRRGDARLRHLKDLPALTWKPTFIAAMLRTTPEHAPTVGVLVLPERPAWRGGRLSRAELAVLAGDAEYAASPHAVSSAIDAVGARILLRLLPSGYLEAIPFCLDDEHPVLLGRGSKRANRTLVHFVAPLRDRIITDRYSRSMIVDVAREISFPTAADGPGQTIGELSRMFVEHCNPAFGSPFHFEPGRRLRGSLDADKMEEACRLVHQAIIAEGLPIPYSVTVRLPRSPAGLIRPYSYHTLGGNELPDTNRIYVLVMAAMLPLKGWSLRTRPINSNLDPSRTLEDDVLNVTVRTPPSGHERLEATVAIAKMWRETRADPIRFELLRMACQSELAGTLAGLDADYG